MDTIRFGNQGTGWHGVAEPNIVFPLIPPCQVDAQNSYGQLTSADVLPTVIRHQQAEIKLCPPPPVNTDGRRVLPNPRLVWLSQIWFAMKFLLKEVGYFVRLFRFGLFSIEIELQSKEAAERENQQGLIALLWLRIYLSIRHYYLVTFHHVFIIMIKVAHTHSRVTHKKEKRERERKRKKERKLILKKKEKKGSEWVEKKCF